MQRGLWLVALVFAGFLIGLGGKIITNIWHADSPAPIESFVDPVKAPVVRAAANDAETKRTLAGERLDQARQQPSVAQSNTRTAQQTFQNWRSSRHATAQPDQDAALIARTRELDALKAGECTKLAAVQRNPGLSLI